MFRRAATECWVGFVFSSPEGPMAVDDEFHRRLPEQFPQFPGAMELFTRDPALRERSALLNGALQAAYFLIGARAAGLAAGPMSGFDEDGVNREFFPDGRLSALFVVNLGRPEPGPRTRGPRLAYDEIRTTLWANDAMTGAGPSPGTSGPTCPGPR
ncbi:hypothetical protein ACFWFF_31040 [Streptomyces sp. NPDC060223]|uniref:hypothetical protein n=1 Tax=unclassified Streptomyces TaxID=2593676 RepID=UPI00362EE192